jgi:uncharacterized protein involved in outer membrane biogenesis
MLRIQYILLFLGGLFVVCLVFIAIVLLSFDNEDYRRLVTKGVKHFTGHQMTIEGPFAIELSLTPSLSAETIRFDAGPDKKVPSVTKIGKFKIQVALRHLIRGLVVIQELLLEDVIMAVVLEKDSASKNRSAFAPPGIKFPILEKVRLRNIHLDVVDKAEDRTVEIRLRQFDIDDVRDAGPLLVTGQGSVSGNEFKLDGQLGALAAMLKGAQPYPVSLNMNAAGFNLSMVGTIDDPLEGKGMKLHLSGEAGELSRFFKLLQMDVPLLGQLLFEATVTRDMSAPGLSDLHVSLTGDPRVALTVDGSVANLFSGEGANIQFAGSCSKPDLLTLLLSDAFPALKQIQASGELRDREGALVVENLEANAAAEPEMALAARGRFCLSEIVNLPTNTETDLNIKLSMPTAEWLRDHLFAWLPELAPVTAYGRLTGSLKRLSVEDMVVKAGGSGPVSVIFRGRIGQLPGGGDRTLSGMDLSASIEAQSIQLLSSGFGITLPDLGTLSLYAQIRGSSQQFQLAEIDVRTNHAGGLTVDLSGNIGFKQDTNKGFIGNLALQTRMYAPTMEAALRPLGAANLPNLTPVRARARIRGTTRTLSLEEIAISIGQSSHLQMELTGSVDQVPLIGNHPASGVRLEMSFAADSTSDLRQLTDVAIPDFGPLKVRAQIDDRNGIYGMHQLNLVIGDEKGSALTVAGRIASFLKGYDVWVDGIELAASARDFDLQPILHFLGPTWPDLGVLNGGFKIAGSPTQLEVSQANLEAASKQGLIIKATGDVRRIQTSGRKRLSGVDVALTASAPGLEIWPGWARLDLPNLGPLQITAGISDHKGSLDVNTFEIRSGSNQQPMLRLQGQIQSLGDLKQMVLETTVETVSQPCVAAFMGRPEAVSVPLAGAIRLVGESDGLRVDDFRMGATEEDGLILSAKGRLSHPHEAPTVDLELNLTATDPPAIGSMLGVSLPSFRPLQINGRMNGSLQNIQFSGKTHFGDTAIQSRVSAAFTGARPRIDARFGAASVNLEDIGIIPAPPRPNHSRDRSKTQPRKTGQLFNESPFPFDALKNVDLYMAVDARKLVAKDIALKNLDIDIQLKDGRLHIYPASMIHGGGYTAFDFIIDASGASPQIRFKFIGDDINLEEVLDTAREPLIMSGDLSLVVDMQSSGRSPREIASNLEGEFSAAIENGQIRRIIDFLSADAFNLVFAAADRRRSTTLHCLANKIQFKDGVGDIELFYLDAARVQAGAAGSINLAAETIDVYIYPRRQRRIRQSEAAVVQINGPLGRPSVRALPLSEALQVSGQLLLSLAFLPERAMGGLLGGVWSLIRNDEEETPCMYK